jgi:hypothetical protein
LNIFCFKVDFDHFFLHGAPSVEEATQEQENEFMKKIQAMGVVGQTAASLLRLFKK